MKRKRTRTKRNEPNKPENNLPNNIAISEKIKKLRMHPIHELPPNTGDQILVYSKYQGYDILMAGVARQHILDDMGKRNPIWKIQCWRFLPK